MHIKRFLRATQTGLSKLTLVIICAMALNLATTGVQANTAKADFCSDLSSQFAGFLDCESSFKSFTEFQGGLAAPDITGYDSTLTEATDAKTYAKNIANFALGFLGLIAVLIIVYAGFLYVTSQGSDDKIGEAKNAITYAVIGIVIIFSSYAIINTVLQAPGGDGDNIRQQAGVRGSATDGTNRAQLANFNTVAEQVKAMTTDVIKEYQRTQETYTQLQTLTTFKPNDIVTRTQYIEYLQYLKSSLQAVKRRAGAASYTAASIDATINQVLNPGIQSIQQRIIEEEFEAFNDTVGENATRDFFEEIGSGFRDFLFNNFGRANAEIRTIFECNLPIEERSVNFDFKNCENTLSKKEKSNIGVKIDEAFDTLITEQVIKNGLFKDYDNTLQLQIDKLERLKASIISYNNGNADIMATLSDLEDLFTASVEKLEALKSGDGSSAFNDYIGGSSDFSTDVSVDVDLSAIRETIESFQGLYNYILNLKFTVPVISASVRQGSAPLIVDFDASSSYDPQNKTLTNGDFAWDPDGDGRTGVDNQEVVSCFGADNSEVYYKRAAITCVYKRPGAFLPSLVAAPVRNTRNTVQPVLPGVAYVPITVVAPTARINLVARPKNTETVIPLREYDDNGNLALDISELAVTLEQAKAGIEFDATGTDTSNAVEGRKIVRYQWIFNDNAIGVIGSGTQSRTGNNAITGAESGTTVTENAIKVTRVFNKRGLYTAQLVVTDTQGNIDRKMFNIRITELVANIEIAGGANGLVGTPGQEFTFDASGSRSDISPNLNYKWIVNGEEFNTNDNPVFKYKFNTPGEKTVKLIVTQVGVSNKTAEKEITVNIESRKPTALFEVSLPEASNRPSFVVLDATNSTDPDAGDTLTYAWRIFNAENGTDYEIISGTANNEPTDNPKLELIFKKKGVFKVELTVADQHEGDMKKTSSISRDITINTILDIKFADNQAFASQLNSNAQGSLAATVDFKLESKNAQFAEVDFGDNSEIEILEFRNGEASVQHIYTRSGTFEVSVKARKGTDQNIVKTVILIGGGSNPIAIPKVKIGGATITNLTEIPSVYKESPITFDASGSVNANGVGGGLKYTWNFGDGKPSREGAVITNYKFDDLPPRDPGYFEVKLTVSSQNNPALTDTRTFPIKVIGGVPTVQALDAKIQDNKDTTPLNVRVQAIGAVDRDGEITKYRFYYFPIDDPTRELGVKEVTQPNTILTIDTFGEEGEEVEYGICVDVEDNEDNLVECNELFPNASYAKITATNGKNEPPKADFRLERTSVNVGETVRFIDASRDPDGKIVEWTYDFEGDNSFANNKRWEQGDVNHVYTKKSPEGGYKVRLRVLDSKGATSVSETKTIFVDGLLSEPTAAFTFVSQNLSVQLQSKSKADEDNGGEIKSYVWDVDANVDSDGDGDPKNDEDLTGVNPTYKYRQSGAYDVTLTVTDSESNEASITRKVIIQGVPSGVDDPFRGQNNNTAEAKDNIIRTNPTKNPETGTITLTGTEQKVTFYFDQLPASTRQILIDENIYFDSSGDGVRNNDLDLRKTNLQPIQITYRAADAARTPIRVQVAYTDENGKIFSEQADIKFGTESDLQARLKYNPADNVPAFIYFLVLLTISISSSYIVKMLSKKNKKKIKI